MQAFLKNLCLRPSCYACAFKNKIRQSDITLADFWGVQSVMPEMYNHKGTSLVIINSQKGEELFNSIKDRICYLQANIDVAVKYNTAMVKSASAPVERNGFIETAINKGFNKAKDKYLMRSLPRRIITKIRRVFTKFLINKTHNVL